MHEEVLEMHKESNCRNSRFGDSFDEFYCNYIGFIYSFHALLSGTIRTLGSVVPTESL